jgi:Tol biopolymer transport system component
MDGWKITAGATLLAVGLAVPARAQVTQRVSVAASGAQGNSDSSFPSISADGRYVAFQSRSSNLVPDDMNGFMDVFIRDRTSGTTELVSSATDGTQGNGDTIYPSISADGRYVAFESDASNLLAAPALDSNGCSDVFVRDLVMNTVERVSVATSGAEADAGSHSPAISADGRFVAFWSYASNLIPMDNNGTLDVFVRDRLLGTTECVSVDPTGVPGNSDSSISSISGDGRFVAFHSYASNLVPGDNNNAYDVFVRDRLLGTTERASIESNGSEGNGDSLEPSISDDGHYIAFESDAPLVVDDNNFQLDIFVHDRLSGMTERVSVDSAGGQSNDGSAYPSISADGRYVAFHSFAWNLVVGDTNGGMDIFMRDRFSGITQRISVDSRGMQANGQSYSASISGDGRFVAFWSYASNLVPGDTNGSQDVLVRDLQGGGLVNLCDAGVGDVRSCPCSNPPSRSGRGCNNSALTGGAMLSATGGAYLSSDSLVFTTSEEKPTALSIVMQGNGVIPNGVMYGQGVRCLGGTIIRRLYTSAAEGGSITVPNFGAGDPTVSARSAAKGDPIQASQSRWYLVYYRDPVVLGGCPASSTFNATQTGRVDWSF